MIVSITSPLLYNLVNAGIIGLILGLGFAFTEWLRCWRKNDEGVRYYAGPTPKQHIIFGLATSVFVFFCMIFPSEIGRRAQVKYQTASTECAAVGGTLIGNQGDKEFKCVLSPVFHPLTTDGDKITKK